MKFIALILSVALYCCGNAKEAASHQTRLAEEKQENLSGIYNITFMSNVETIPSELNITFDTSINKASGFSGCNNFFSNYTIEGNFIKFGVFGMTHRLCKQYMDVEENMIKILTESNTFSIDNGTLKLYNDKTDSHIMGTKIQNVRISQNDTFTLEYIAETRGSYKMVSINNNTVSYSNLRDVEPISRVCHEDEIKSIHEYLNKIELNKLETLKAPSDGRFTDRAAIGKFKIIHKGMTFKTPEFDDGNPNQYIADLIKAMTSLMEKQ